MIQYGTRIGAFGPVFHAGFRRLREGGSAGPDTVFLYLAAIRLNLYPTLRQSIGYAFNTAVHTYSFVYDLKQTKRPYNGMISRRLAVNIRLNLSTDDNLHLVNPIRPLPTIPQPF